MSKDDIWQSEPTVIKPSPGGRRGRKADDGQSETTTLFSALKGDESSAGLDYRSSNLPFIVSAARPQLNLLDRLRTMQSVPDVEQLRMAVIEEMRSYERRIANAGVDMEHARIAHYALCATIDDVVLATPWGANSSWGTNSIVSTFHRDVQGGERVFELLEHQHRDPGRNRDVLFLLYFCLSLGFRGRLRISPRGSLELSQIRDGLYRTLQGSMGDLERELSPQWRGINARNAKSGWRHVLPAFLAMMVLLVALGYVGVLNLLNTKSDDAIVTMASLPPIGTPSIKVDAPVAEPSDQADVIDNFLVFLKPEVERGVLTTTRNGKEVLVIFRNTGTFGAGSADVSSSFQQLLARVGKAIEDARFDVLITGHTDNRPIRTVRFPSNWHLSQARARAVSEIITQSVKPGRVRFEGRGETEPVNTNDTPQGREANRRIEMLVRYTRDTDTKVIVQEPGATQP
jgi:type VI secretion system protein ImpK